MPETRTVIESRFCAPCQAVTDHDAEQVLRRGEWETDTLTCQVCGFAFDNRPFRVSRNRRVSGRSRRGSWQGGWTGR